MNVNLHIDRLVIEGLPLGTRDAPGLQAAIEAELAHLLAASGQVESFGASRAVPHVRAEPIAAPADADRLGTQIGQAVFGSIGR